MTALTPAERQRLVREAIDALDPRLSESVATAVGRDSASPSLRLDPRSRIVLAGHRASGKTRLLPAIARLAGRTGFDLDQEIERRSGRAILEWFQADPPGFRAAERTTYSELPRDSVVAVGGGFLSLHADLLAADRVVLVPVTLETYRERLLADASRPRLRPDLTAEEEIARVFAEREAAHARVPTVPLSRLLRALLEGSAVG